jgi:hypothetical protein
MKSTSVLSDPVLIALAKKKKALLFRTDQTCADWVQLADEYADAGARGGMAYCLWMSKSLEVSTDPDDIEEVAEPEEPPFDWQERADIGDD